MSTITTTASKKPIISKKIISQINGTHLIIEGMGDELIEKACIAGELLSKVKADLPHGTFMKWVEENLNFSHRTATNYMRLNDLAEAGKLENVGT
jgi:hypothetical protein